MYLKLLDMDKFVAVNGLVEITDPVYLEHKKPTPEGLFSREIFGITQYDRSTVWAYMDLGAKFLHPLAAVNFKAYGTMFENMIYSLKNYRFENGKFIEDEENGETGVDFLYSHYDEIEWRETPSISSSERIKFLKQGKDKLFITKFPICPPYYRDINDNSNIGIPVVNELYKKIISQSSALKRGGTFSFFGNLTKSNIQRTIVDIYNHYISLVKGKNGILRKSVMGRNVTYGTWLVVSAPVISGERYTDMSVDFDHFGYPLAAVLSMFKPFILHEIKEFFENEFIRTGTVGHRSNDGEIKQLHYIDPMSEFTNDFINNKISQFINGHSTRFEAIKTPTNHENIKGYLSLKGRFKGSTEISTRALTWTDVFYLAAVRAVANKHSVQSRYPIEHFYSLSYPKIRVMSTINTISAFIDEVEYKWYPDVKPNMDSSNMFVNTMSPCNVHIAAQGMDFDGDSVPNRGIFTTEANIDAVNFSRDKKNFLNLVGKNIRTTERDFIQLIYSLSKPPITVNLEDLN